MQQAISSKEPSVKTHFDTGDSLKTLVATDKVPDIEEPQKDVEKKYKALKVDVEALAKKMFSEQERVQKFQIRFDELLVWLTQTEEILATLEPVGVEPERVKIQLAEQTVCH